MFQIGDRVRVNSWLGSKRSGVIVGERNQLGQFLWEIRLDTPRGKRTTILVPAPSIQGIGVPTRLRAGDSVVVIAGVLRNHTGTLVRPARLLWKKAWLVDLDTRHLGRTRITERLLRRRET